VEVEKAYKVCPGCEAEYLPSVEVCLDCGLPLVSEGEAREPGWDKGLVLPPGEGLVLVREADLRWAVGLGRAFAEAGIPHRLDPASRTDAGLRWAVWVGAPDAPQAAAVDAEYARRELPEMNEAPSELGAAPSDDRCPACGEALAADARECPECGLVFGPAQ
jgi:hypothetical protein